MARRPSVRENYRQDAINLHRMIGAIELDVTSPDAWKKKVKEHLGEAMRLMLEHGTVTKGERKAG